jgi:hypothetical protein
LVEGPDNYPDDLDLPPWISLGDAWEVNEKPDVPEPELMESVPSCATAAGARVTQELELDSASEILDLPAEAREGTDLGATAEWMSPSTRQADVNHDLIFHEEEGDLQMLHQSNSCYSMVHGKGCVSVYGLPEDATEREVYILFSGCSGFERAIVSNRRPLAWAIFSGDMQALEAVESRRGTRWSSSLNAIVLDVTDGSEIIDEAVSSTLKQQERGEKARELQGTPPRHQTKRHSSSCGHRIESKRHGGSRSSVSSGVETRLRTVAETLLDKALTGSITLSEMESAMENAIALGLPRKKVEALQAMIEVREQRVHTRRDTAQQNRQKVALQRLSDLLMPNGRPPSKPVLERPTASIQQYAQKLQHALQAAISLGCSGADVEGASALVEKIDKRLARESKLERILQHSSDTQEVLRELEAAKQEKIDSTLLRRGACVLALRRRQEMARQSLQTATECAARAAANLSGANCLPNTTARLKAALDEGESVGLSESELALAREMLCAERRDIAERRMEEAVCRQDRIQLHNAIQEGLDAGACQGLLERAQAAEAYLTGVQAHQPWQRSNGHPACGVRRPSTASAATSSTAASTSASVSRSSSTPRFQQHQQAAASTRPSSCANVARTASTTGHTTPRSSSRKTSVAS